MASAVRLRTDFTAGELRQLAKKAKHVNQSRRLLSLAAVIDGMSRTEAAMIGGMDRTAKPCATGFTGSTRRAQMGCWTTGRVGRCRVFRQCKKASSPGSSNQALTGKSTGWSVGGALILSASLLSGSALIIASATWERFSENSASRTSLRGRVIRPRMPRRSKLIKKLCPHAERPSVRSTKGNSYRSLVPGRGSHRPEERPRPPMG